MKSSVMTIDNVRTCTDRVHEHWRKSRVRACLTSVLYSVSQGNPWQMVVPWKRDGEMAAVLCSHRICLLTLLLNPSSLHHAHIPAEFCHSCPLCSHLLLAAQDTAQEPGLPDGCLEVALMRSVQTRDILRDSSAPSNPLLKYHYIIIIICETYTRVRSLAQVDN